VLLLSAVGAAALVAAAPAVAHMFAAVDASRDPRAVAAMAPTLVVLAPGLLGYALIFQLSRVLFALERGRAAVVAVAIGWLSVVVASVIAVQVIAPQGDDGAGTLRALAIGNTIGMTIAGLALLIAVRRSAGPPALTGVPRTLVVSFVGAGLGAVGGRWVVDAVFGLTVPSVLSAVVAGLGGAAFAALVVAAATWVGDRSTITGALTADRVERRPGVTPTEFVHRPHG